MGGLHTWVKHVPEEERIIWLFNFHSDRLVAWTAFDLFDILKHFNFPCFLKDFSFGVENDAMQSIEHDYVLHQNSTQGLPINKRLAINNNLQGRRYNNFEDTHLILKKSHNFFIFCIDSCKGIVDIAFMKHFEIRKAKQNDFLLFLSDDVVFVIEGYDVVHQYIISIKNHIMIAK